MFEVSQFDRLKKRGEKMGNLLFFKLITFFSAFLGTIATQCKKIFMIPLTWCYSEQEMEEFSFVLECILPEFKRKK